jgi:hypothetical protein
MESIGQLTGGIAHDFNNLMAVILGNLELLAEDLPGNVAAQQKIHTAIRSTLRVLGRRGVLVLTDQPAYQDDDRDTGEDRQQRLVEGQAVVVRLQILFRGPPEEPFADEQSEAEEGSGADEPHPRGHTSPGEELRE